MGAMLSDTAAPVPPVSKHVGANVYNYDYYRRPATEAAATAASSVTCQQFDIWHLNESEEEEEEARTVPTKEVELSTQTHMCCQSLSSQQCSLLAANRRAPMFDACLSAIWKCVALRKRRKRGRIFINFAKQNTHTKFPLRQVQGKTANYLVLTFYAQTLTETTAFTFHSERSSHRSLSAVQSSPPALAHWTVTSLSHSSASPYLFSLPLRPPSLCLPRRFLLHSFFRLFWLFRAPYQQVLAQLTHTQSSRA